MPAVVNKVLKQFSPSGMEKVEISILDADDLFREIRVENLLTDGKGNMLALQPGVHLDVRLEADRDSLNPKTRNP